MQTEPQSRSRVSATGSRSPILAIPWAILVAFAMLAIPALSPAADSLPTPPRNGPVTAPSSISRHYKLPLLSVYNNVGECQLVEFTLTRSLDSRAPLSLSLSEDTPGGAGESVRASFWMAAMVSALDLQDELSGVRISLQIPGAIDGPSAGGALALAIRSALDDRTFPTDCAMTGAIMPDGAIGAVGGMALKMQGAAKAGLKRVLVPAYLRFERNPITGKDVDLKQLASDLGLKFLPVENLAQAYEELHGIVSASAPRPSRNVLDVPRAAEELLQGKYQKDLAAGQKLWDAIPVEYREQIVADPVTRPLLVDARTKAESALRAGRLLYAASSMQMWRVFLEARKANVEAFGSLTGQDRQANLKQIEDKMLEIATLLPQPLTLLSQGQQSLPELGAQLCPVFFEIDGIMAGVDAIDSTARQVLGEIADPKNSAPEAQEELFTRLEVVRALQLLGLRAAQAAASELVPDTQKLAATLPPGQMAADPVGVERLFFSAYLAAHNTFTNDVVKQYARELNVSDAAALEAMRTSELSLASYTGTAPGLQVLHRSLGAQADPQARRIAYAAAAHIYAAYLAQVSAHIVRWSELEPSLNAENELEYGRTDLLNYLLRSARETALANIAQCKARGIPCVQPIADFELADFDRDNRLQDKVDTLSGYWTASLQAKVLLMLGAREVSVPSQSRGLPAGMVAPADGQTLQAGRTTPPQSGRYQLSRQALSPYTTKTNVYPTVKFYTMLAVVFVLGLWRCLKPTAAAEVTLTPRRYGMRVPSFFTPFSEQAAPPPPLSANSDTGHRPQMANEGMARNFIALFILFCASLIAVLLAMIPEIGEGGALVVRFIGLVLVAVFLRSSMPKFYLILIMLGAGVMGLIYLLVCWNDLIRLPQLAIGMRSEAKQASKTRPPTWPRGEPSPRLRFLQFTSFLLHDQRFA